MVVRNYQLRPILLVSKLRLVAEVAGSTNGEDAGTIGFAFVDDMRMTDHHRRFLGKETTTDVLSFPVASGQQLGVAAKRERPTDSTPGDSMYWGDVMICTDQAARQARQLRHPYLYELTVLALHGALHLLGYDHTRDGGTMSQLEFALRPRCMAAGTMP